MGNRVDANGNLHRGTGDRGGQFESKLNSAPGAELAEGVISEEALLGLLSDELPEGHPLRDDPARLRLIALSVAGASASADLLEVTRGARALRDDIFARSVAAAVLTAERKGIRAVVAGDGSWPAGFDDLGDDKPAVLWSRGDLSALGDRERLLTIVGSRSSSGFGEQATEAIARAVSEAGGSVVCDGGYGIAGAAIRGSLDAGGKPIVFLPSGVDRLYPAGHVSLFEKVESVGGVVVSEFPPGGSPTMYRLQRNMRLLAAASTATLVGEAGSRSRSLGAVGHSLALRRQVFAVPGAEALPSAAGTNRLIEMGDATPVSDAGAVVAALRLS